MLYKKTKSGHEFYISQNSIGKDFSIDIQKDGMTYLTAKQLTDKLITILELDN